MVLQPDDEREGAERCGPATVGLAARRLTGSRTAPHRPHGWCHNRQGSDGLMRTGMARLDRLSSLELASTGQTSSRVRASTSSCSSVWAAAQVGEATAGKTMIGGPFQLVDQNGKTFTDRCSLLQAGSLGLPTTRMFRCATISCDAAS